MSNGEVKRFKFINGVGNWSHEEAVLASDHDRIVAELKAYVEETNRILRDVDKQCYQDERTIAKQTKVIEIAKRVLYNAGLRPPDGGTPTVETICEDLNDAIKKIAAIERAEGSD